MANSVVLWPRELLFSLAWCYYGCLNFLADVVFKHFLSLVLLTRKNLQGREKGGRRAEDVLCWLVVCNHVKDVLMLWSTMEMIPSC